MNESTEYLQVVGEEAAQEGFEGPGSLLGEEYSWITAHFPELEDAQQDLYQKVRLRCVLVAQALQGDQLSDSQEFSCLAFSAGL